MGERNENLPQNELLLDTITLCQVVQYIASSTPAQLCWAFYGGKAGNGPISPVLPLECPEAHRFRFCPLWYSRPAPAEGLKEGKISLIFPYTQHSCLRTKT